MNRNDLSQMRQCDKCRKQIPARDHERHVENCQRVMVHTSQNAQGPKIIDFTTIDSGIGPQNLGRVAKKPRVASAKPPRRVVVN